MSKKASVTDKSGGRFWFVGISNFADFRRVLPQLK
jgi:hypothetical protein